MFIEDICNKNLCVGCGNCSNICPAKAILMKPNDEGFLHPFVNHEMCVNCQMCEKVCPHNGLIYKDVPDLPKTCLVRSKNEEILKSSASGGLCSTLASFFVEEMNGYVCGAVYDDSFKVHHIVSNALDDIRKMSSSKYVQSNLGNVFTNVKNKLNEGLPVLMIGTGCQIYALKKFLRKEYENLFCIDVICHGTPSPKVQEEYLKWLEAQKGEVKNINNRNKKYYPHGYVCTYKVLFKNDKLMVNRYSGDPMAHAFFSHLSIRKSCFNCQFKSIHRISDLTVGDFWFSEMYGMGEDKLGINLCLVQSDKGRNLLNSISELIEEKEIDAESAIVQNGGMIYGSCKENPCRTEFFEKLGKISFDDLVYGFDNRSLINKIKSKVSDAIAPLLRCTKYYNHQLKKSASMRKKRKIPDERKGLICYKL